MSLHTVQALESLANQLDEKSPCGIKHLSRTEQVCLQLPWLAEKLTYEEIGDVVHWCTLLWSYEDKEMENNKLNVANLTRFKDSEVISRSEQSRVWATREQFKKTTEVRLEFLRSKNLRQLVRKYKKAKAVLSKYNREMKSSKETS